MRMFKRTVIFLVVLSVIISPWLASTDVASGLTSDNLNFQAEGICGGVMLTWNDAYPDQWYMPEMVLSDDSSYPLIDYAIDDTSFFHQGVVNDQEYCYVLKVVDQGDNQLHSTEQVCATPHCDEGEVPGTQLDCDGECMLFLCFQIDNIEAQVTWAEESFLDVIEAGGLVDGNGMIISNTTLNTPPIISGGRTCAGPRDITDNIPGADIGWDAGEQRVDMTIPTTIYGDNTEPTDFNNLSLWIGQSQAEINGTTMPIDPTNANVKPFIDENNRTQVPVRWISENTGAREVKWLPDSRIAVFVFDVVNCEGESCEEPEPEVQACCEYSFQYGRLPAPVCAGEKFGVPLFIKNLCEDDMLEFKIEPMEYEIEQAGIGEVYMIIPDRIELEAGESYKNIIKTFCRMPEGAVAGQEYEFGVTVFVFDSQDNECDSKSLTFKVECKDCD